ncbi:hypothetical protein C0Z18_11250 [Trinickia dabaoshanensis]|uniref:Uncharacterized protein n=1 Tax=Trinickia dabaoshanensis TaxID=564714 RepID=A0A2N7VS85_9BURK|nr:hypothetical protein C0Z18_11250 [Trinickia dabaoshanensis]
MALSCRLVHIDLTNRPTRRVRRSLSNGPRVRACIAKSAFCARRAAYNGRNFFARRLVDTSPYVLRIRDHVSVHRSERREPNRAPAVKTAPRECASLVHRAP